MIDCALIEVIIQEEFGQGLGIDEHLNHSVHIARVTEVNETDEVPRFMSSFANRHGRINVFTWLLLQFLVQ